MLLTLGDSFTVKRYDGDKPWSEQLAEKLGMELLNVSHEGESNSYMFRNAIWALTTQDVELCVISLTNWDRFELPYSDYGLKGSGMYDRTKTFKPKNCWDEDNPYSKLYIAYYSMLYYVDTTSSYIIAIDNLCKAKGIPLIFTQPLLPFNVRIKAVKTGELDFLFSKNMNAMGEDYIENISLFRHVDKSLFCMFKPTAQTILFGKEDGLSEKTYDNMFSFFTRNHPEYVMGYHNKYIYKGGQAFRKSWDGHPNLKGHQMISDIVYDHYMNM